EGRHKLTGQPRPVSGATDRPRSTSATAEGSLGSCPCDTGPAPQASWRAESGGVTVWSAVVQIDSHGSLCATAAVASSRTSALPGASCLQATGQASGANAAALPASVVPRNGDPSVTTRRALAAPSSRAIH